MQCVQLPSRILEGLDRVNRNFLWGSMDTAKKNHWVGWDKVTKARDEGGLGLQSAKGRNSAFLAKLNWRFHIEGEAPWNQVLKMKYHSQRSRVVINPNKLPYSSVWAALKKGMDTFQKGYRWTVGRNSSLNFCLTIGRLEACLDSLFKALLPKKQAFWKLKTYWWIRVGIREKFLLSFQLRSNG